MILGFRKKQNNHEKMSEMQEYSDIYWDDINFYVEEKIPFIPDVFFEDPKKIFLPDWIGQIQGVVHF